MKDIIKYKNAALVGGLLGTIFGSFIFSLLDYLLEFNNSFAGQRLGNILEFAFPAISGAYWGAKLQDDISHT